MTDEEEDQITLVHLATEVVDAKTALSEARATPDPADVVVAQVPLARAERTLADALAKVLSTNFEQTRLLFEKDVLLERERRKRDAEQNQERLEQQALDSANKRVLSKFQALLYSTLIALLSVLGNLIVSMFTNGGFP